MSMPILTQVMVWKERRKKGRKDSRKMEGEKERWKEGGKKGRKELSEKERTSTRRPIMYMELVRATAVAA
jgi:hypothetical protein